MKSTLDGEFLIELIKHRIEEVGAMRESINLDTRDKSSRNALYWAIVYEHIDAVKLFLEAGISLEVAPEMSALELARSVGNQTTLSLLGEEQVVALSA